MKSTSSHKNKSSSDDSEDIDNYRNALTTSLNNLSNNDEDNIGPTDDRIEFVKKILGNDNLINMIDFTNKNDKDLITLNKKILDVKELFGSMNVKLKYLKSGATGHTFKASSKIDKNIAFAVKVCAYPKDEYGSMNNISRPENAELRMIKLLSQFVINKNTPHIVLPIGSFNTSIINFVKIPKNIIDLESRENKSYKKFIIKYKKGKFEDFVSILISEWCNGGDLLDYLRKNCDKLKLKEWVIIFFQLLFTLARIQQKYPTFRHNDLKANNILVRLSNTKDINKDNRYHYSLDDKATFFIPDINLQIGIWDYDFASIDGIIENNKVNAEWTKKINVSKNENKYYDVHYFFNTLISKEFLPNFYTSAPEEIIKFIHRVVPKKYRTGEKYVTKKGRILTDNEYLTPYKIIMEDKLFDKYRFKNV